MSVSASTFFVGAVRTTIAASAALFVAGACGPRVEVLEEGVENAGTAGASSGAGGDSAYGGESGDTAGSGGNAGGGTGAGGATAGAAAAGAAAGTGAGGRGGGLDICGGLSVSQVDSLKMGDACRSRDICEPQACLAGRGPDNSNTAIVAACRNQRVQPISMTLLDVPSDGSGNLSVSDDGVIWTDCESALDGGASGQACTWIDNTCLRQTEDTCCIEGAECFTYGPTSPNGLLHRVRICAPGCAEAMPDSTAPIVTDCAEANSVDSCHATPACEGDFACYRAIPGPWDVVDYSATSQLNGVMWCAGGSLVGGYGTSWGL